MTVVGFLAAFGILLWWSLDRWIEATSKIDAERQSVHSAKINSACRLLFLLRDLSVAENGDINAYEIRMFVIRMYRVEFNKREEKRLLSE